MISIVAPSDQQRVTFYFDQRISANDNSTNNTTKNASNDTSDPFYDQVNVMVPEGTCMYLNTSSMLWQTDGCRTDRGLSTSLSVTCTCEHLTMFTVFFSLTCATPSKALLILSWVGCALSLVGLSLTLIMFVVISQCRQTKSPSHGNSSSHTSSSQELRRRVMVRIFFF